jgi:MTH538 TIR-like domain (DUF1863)
MDDAVTARRPAEAGGNTVITPASQVESGSDTAVRLSAESGVGLGDPRDFVRYDAFISYSHAVDRRLAAAIEKGVSGVANRLEYHRSLRLFHDETCLSADADLWRSIETALHNSEWFVLCCSPEAARSPWVNKEIDTWVAGKPVERIVPVLTAGVIAWDADAHDFTVGSSAVPSALRGRYREAPHYIDLRWAHAETSLDLRNASFRAALAILAARIDSVQCDAAARGAGLAVAGRAREHATA